MKAVVFTKSGSYEIKDIEIPKINDDEVLIKNKYAGFCGTDLKIFKGDYVVNFPVIPGHEFSGIIEKVGNNIKKFKKGDRIAIDQTLSCGICYYCKRNKQNLCENRGSFGTTLNGGFAEYTKVFETNLHSLSSYVSFKEAALQEPLGCSISGAEKLKVYFGDKALIFGAGPMGLIMLQLLNLRGVSNLTMVDLDKEKLEVAIKLGASEVFLNDENLDNKLKSVSKYGFDIVIDATGVAKVCEQLFEYVNKDGRILFFGLCGSKERISISPYQIHRNDLSIYGSFSLKRNTAQALELLENKRIDLESLISHEFNLTEFSEAFALAKSGKAIKILFNCSEV